MFDLGWTELLVIGVVALIVVGPKDLPVLFRNIGRFVGKAKGMAREFSTAMNQAADDAGVKDMAKGLKTATNPIDSALDGVKDAAKSFNFDPDSETGKLAAERKEQAQQLKDAAAARKEAARAANAAAENPPQFGVEKTSGAGKPATKSTAKKTAAAKPKKPAASKSAPAKAPTKKATASTRTSAAKKPAAKKPAAKKTAPKDKA